MGCSKRKGHRVVCVKSDLELLRIWNECSFQFHVSMSVILMSLPLVMDQLSSFLRHFILFLWLYPQVMVFVHARNATVHTASKLEEIARKRGESSMFQPASTPELGSAAKQVRTSYFVFHHVGTVNRCSITVFRHFYAMWQ